MFNLSSDCFGFVGPAGIPKPTVDKLNGVLIAALRDADNRKILIERGADPVGSTPEEHDAFVKSEIAKWIRVAKEAGIEPQ
jgi:tripartite-type tricarboxylate transporter receptor subunit TctC